MCICFLQVRVPMNDRKNEILKPALFVRLADGDGLAPIQR
jgi:hypothetical protein